MNARLEAAMVNYETDKNKLEATRLLQIQAMAERDQYMERTLTLQKQLLDNEQVFGSGGNYNGERVTYVNI